MKYGFELEAFCLKSHDRTTILGMPLGGLEQYPVLVPDGLPYDECGWLVEIRSTPATDVVEAIHLLHAAREKVEKDARKAQVTLAYVPLFDIPRDLKVKAARKHGKGIIAYHNVHGYETHRTRLATASLHVSFTDERTFHYTDAKGANRDHKYQGFVDHARIIATFDKAFREEIKAAKRNPGFYEVKGDGRIEYRSLPNDVNLAKVQEVLLKLNA